MSKWSIYLVRTRSGSLYTGISTNVVRRFSEHQLGAVKCAKSLRGKGPLTLVFSAEVGDRSEASVLESKVKRMKKSEKEALVNEDILLSELN